MGACACRADGLWGLGVLALLIGVPLLLAHRADSAVLYLADPPAWMRPPAPSDGPPRRFLRRFLLQLRLRHSLLRCFYVAPGYTQLTRLQFLTAFFIDRVVPSRRAENRVSPPESRVCPLVL